MIIRNPTVIPQKHVPCSRSKKDLLIVDELQSWRGTFQGLQLGAGLRRRCTGAASKAPLFLHMSDPPRLINVPNGSAILHNWNLLHEEQKAYINTMFAVIDNFGG